MNTIIILFASDASLEEPSPEFAEEHKVASKNKQFEVRLFDLERALSEKELMLSKGIPNTRCASIYRGPRLSCTDYKALIKATKDAGIVLITDDWRYTDLHRFQFDHYHVVGEEHRDTPAFAEIRKDSSYTAFTRIRRELCRKDGDSTYYAPVYGGTSDKLIIKNLDLDAKVIKTVNKITKEELSEVREAYPISEIWGLYSNLIVQEYVDLKDYDGKSNEWRGWFFDGTMFALCPNSGQPNDAPKPPDWLIEKHLSESPFFTLDFAELTDGDWLIIGSEDGQVAKLAKCQTPEDFYQDFGKAVSETPHLPEWIWCLVANVDEDAKWTAPDGNTLKGTKHFRPGAKMYISSEWHGGWGDYTFVVIGQPRNQRRLIQIYMQHKHLCNFRLKKVYDKRVIERMTRGDRGCPVLGKSKNSHGGWDNSDKSRKEIEEWVDILTREYAERHQGKEEAAD